MSPYDECADAWALARAVLVATARRIDGEES